MLITKKSGSGRAPEALDRRPMSALQLGDQCEALDKSTIAELSGTLIDSMSREELVRVIRAAELLPHFRDELQRALPFYDCELLRRLAHLAKRCCQNQGH